MHSTEVWQVTLSCPNSFISGSVGDKSLEWYCWRSLGSRLLKHHFNCKRISTWAIYILGQSAVATSAHTTHFHYCTSNCFKNLSQISYRETHGSKRRNFIRVNKIYTKYHFITCYILKFLKRHCQWLLLLGKDQVYTLK